MAVDLAARDAAQPRARALGDTSAADLFAGFKGGSRVPDQ